MSKSTPAQPNYVGAAQATASGNLEAARLQTNANRVNQVTPYGNLTYTRGDPNQFFDQSAYNQAYSQWWNQGNRTQNAANMPKKESFGYNPDLWTATQTLSPEQQQLLDQQNKTSAGLASLQDQGLSYVQNTLNRPFDQSALPNAPINAGETAQAAIMRRLQPQIDRENAQLQQQMANQGISQGSEAYTNAMRDMTQSQNDREIQAALQGISTGEQARQQAIQEQSFFRNEPINTLNAVRTGSQIQNPSFVGVPQQGQTSGADYSGAAQQQYGSALSAANAQNAQTAGTVQAGTSLASMAALAYMY